MTSFIKSFSKFTAPRAIRHDEYPMMASGTAYPRSGDPRLDLANFQRPQSVLN